jgi:hypothetical protein
MAQFKLTETNGEVRNLDADGYHHEDGMIVFVKDGAPFFSIAASQVTSVVRDDAPEVEPAPPVEPLIAWR